MLFYIFYIILLILLFGKYQINGIPKPRAFTYIGVLFFISVVCFRYDVGYDYIGYYEVLWPTLDEVGIDRWEPICRFFGYIADRCQYPPLFFILTGLLTCFLVFDTIFKYSDNVLLAIFTYLALLYDSLFSIVRQGLAIAIIIYAYRYLKDRNWSKYIICCIVAGFAHHSAFVSLLFPLFYKLTNSTFRVIILIGSFVCFCKLFLVGFFELLEVYEGYANESHIIESGTKLRYLYIFIFSVTYIFACRLKNNDSDRRLIRMALLGVSVMFVLQGLTGLRIALYFMSYMCIVIPRVVNQYSPRLKYIWCFGLSSLFITMIYVTSIKQSKSPYLPYRTIFTIDYQHPEFKY